MWIVWTTVMLLAALSRGEGLRSSLCIYGNVTGVIVVKLPRSGSTWLTEALNSWPNVFISKEIVQHHHTTRIPINGMMQHLWMALRCPTDKIDAQWWRSGRFAEDYFRTGKVFRRMDAVGFSINLEHVVGANWSRIIGDHPAVRVVVFERTNLPKVIVSALRGEQLHRQCGSSNLRTHQSCHLDALHLSTTAFLHQARRWLQRVQSMRAATAAAFAGIPMLSVSYEALQSNFLMEMQHIARFIGVKPHLPSEQSRWQKRTAEDLRGVLAGKDFEAIERLLATESQCVSLLQMLRDDQAGRVQPPWTALTDCIERVSPHQRSEASESKK